MKRPAPAPDIDLTPRARLEEGGIHDLLGYQLAQARIMTNHNFVRAAGKPFGLRPVEFTILQLVKENPDVTATQLARALAISTPALTAWLDKLGTRGLLLRERSATDGRAQHLRLTREGRALVGKALAQLLEADAESLVHLSPAEQAMLLELLRKVSHLPAR